MSPRPALALDKLGPTPQAAVRRLMTELRRRGWRDAGGTAVAIVRTLESSDGGVSAGRAAAAVGSEFLSVNHATRADVEELLGHLAEAGR